jgi:hypothetical protein
VRRASDASKHALTPAQSYGFDFFTCSVASAFARNNSAIRAMALSPLLVCKRDDPPKAIEGSAVSG